MITVVNKRYHRGGGVYIGRPSLLGNPFRIGEQGTRKEVIAKYRAWLWQQIQRQGPVYRELLCLAEVARRGDLYPAILITEITLFAADNWLPDAGTRLPWI